MIVINPVPRVGAWLRRQEVTQEVLEFPAVKE